MRARFFRWRRPRARPNRRAGDAHETCAARRLSWRCARDGGLGKRLASRVEVVSFDAPISDAAELVRLLAPVDAILAIARVHGIPSAHSGAAPEPASPPVCGMLQLTLLGNRHCRASPANLSDGSTGHVPSSRDELGRCQCGGRRRGTASAAPGAPALVRRLGQSAAAYAARAWSSEAYSKLDRVRVRALFHGDGGNRVKVKSCSPASSRLSATERHLSRHLRMARSTPPSRP
jgi:hypothetical protein